MVMVCFLLELLEGDTKLFPDLPLYPYLFTGAPFVATHASSVFLRVATA